jgi:3-phosphoshikimate 1-carboxyvinyltransferase
MLLKKAEIFEIGDVEVQLPTSKSIANRIAMLAAYRHLPIPAFGQNEAEDIRSMCEVLDAIRQGHRNIQIKEAGTVLRFVLPFMATLGGSWTVSLGNRLAERPLHSLIDFLRMCGVQCEYEEKNRLAIASEGLNLPSEFVFGDQQSSQFISAIIMCYAGTNIPATLVWSQAQLSQTYIELTLSVMCQMGFTFRRLAHGVELHSSHQIHLPEKIEKDWSAAAFFKAMELRKNKACTYPQLDIQSAQTDRSCIEILAAFVQGKNEFDEFKQAPDLVPALLPMMCSYKRCFSLHGIESLRVKESDRIQALAENLAAFGVEISSISDKTIVVDARQFSIPTETIAIRSFGDHRIAMGMATLVHLGASMTISDPEVVNKSFTLFWNELGKTGVQMLETNGG